MFTGRTRIKTGELGVGGDFRDVKPAASIFSGAGTSLKTT